MRDVTPYGAKSVCTFSVIVCVHVHTCMNVCARERAVSLGETRSCQEISLSLFLSSSSLSLSFVDAHLCVSFIFLKAQSAMYWVCLCVLSQHNCVHVHGPWQVCVHVWAVPII